ncbi:MAG: hypothetical protein N2255_08145 [Kiritimatiellae bacterium]|nr:hypothetical protein [Kiritimatiellia bacterium]
MNMTAAKRVIWILSLVEAGALPGAGISLPKDAAEPLVIGPALELGGKGAYQRLPALAFSPKNQCYLVVWQDGWFGEGGDANILGLRVDFDGKALDPKPIAICTASGVQEAPSVTWNGTDFTVVWSDFRSCRDYDVYMARVDGDGRIVRPDTPVIRRDRNQVSARVACCVQAGVALIVWQDIRNGQDYRVYAARTRGNELLDPEGIELTSDPSGNPDVAASGEQFAVVWQYNLGRARQIRGCRVGLDGSIGKLFCHNYHGGNELPRVASDGKDFLVVNSRVPFPNYWGWGGGSAFYLDRVLADGSAPDAGAGIGTYEWTLKPCLLDGAWLKGDGGWPHRHSAIAWDGKQYVAVWTRIRIQNQVMPTNPNIYVTRVRMPGYRKLDSPTGAIPDEWGQLVPEKKGERSPRPPAPGIALAATDDPEAMPAIASGPPGRLLVAYEVHKPDGTIVVTVKALTAH